MTAQPLGIRAGDLVIVRVGKAQTGFRGRSKQNGRRPVKVRIRAEMLMRLSDEVVRGWLVGLSVQEDLAQCRLVPSLFLGSNNIGSVNWISSTVVLDEDVPTGYAFRSQ